MAIRPLVLYPDPRLRQPATLVTVFDEALQALVGDLLDTMRAAPGVGITGPHIGALWRVSVLELQPGEVRVYINPWITWASDETQTHEEGSVCMPGAVETVTRPARVRVDYQDLTCTPVTEEAEGFLAVCLQHEIDQLDGMFWLQRLSRLKRERLVQKWEKLQKR